MKLKDANMSGPFKAESAIVAADPPSTAFEDATTDFSGPSQYFSGFNLQSP